MKNGFRSSALLAVLVVGIAGCITKPASQTKPAQQQPQAAVAAPVTESPVEPAPAADTEKPAETPAPPPAQEPQSAPLAIKETAPRTYVVVKGDTLWGLATQYLDDPWRWPELWYSNPKVRNPHLIYPGDVLTLFYVDGRPQVQVQRGEETVPPTETAPAPEQRAEEGAPAGGLPLVKLEPQIRVEPLTRAIPTIPLDAISQFLSRPRIVTQQELDTAPYIVSSVDEHLIAGAGYRVYVRGIGQPETADYVVIRRGQAYVNPDNPDDILGFEAIHVADAQLQRPGDPATALLVRTNREVLTGDRLLPAEDGFVDQNYQPRAPAQDIQGRIVGVMGAVSQIGQFQVVVIDKGLQQDLEAGNVLAIFQAGGRARDPYTREVVTLPRERAGTLMVFRVFDRVSYALVMDATRPIHLHDAVTNP